MLQYYGLLKYRKFLIMDAYYLLPVTKLCIPDWNYYRIADNIKGDGEMESGEDLIAGKRRMDKSMIICDKFCSYIPSLIFTFVVLPIMSTFYFCKMNVYWILYYATHNRASY